MKGFKDVIFVNEDIVKSFDNFKDVPLVIRKESLKQKYNT